MHRRWGVGIVVFAAACLAGTEPGAGDDPARSGGDMTVFDATSNAFSSPAPNLSPARLQQHFEGDAQFEATFVAPPAPVNPGLGPLYDNVACRACHIGDGRGRPPEGSESFSSMLLRLSIAGADAHGGPAPAPGFGGQLQARGVAGVTPEGEPTITYQELPGTYGDGQSYSLRRPQYTIANPYTALPPGLLVSPRAALPVFGLGLLEAVPEADVLSRADPTDGNGDGISGRPNYVYNPTLGTTQLGRFGWKASAATLLHQTSGAYNEDMGVTSSYLPAEACAGQVPACDDHAPEVSDDVVALVALYVRTLGVPARRQVGDPTTRRGSELFQSIGCAACHTPTLLTGTMAGEPEVSNQRIHPYTDLLLHDMGDGLADLRPDYAADGREWRTPPLWGIGLTVVVNGHTYFLHDGRARNLAEAVLWHGGEAEAARERFRNLPAADRAALLAFLGSL